MPEEKNAGPTPPENLRSIYPNERRIHQEAQNRAAGSERQRYIELSDGTRCMARVRVHLPRPRAKTSYAEMVWTVPRTGRRQTFVLFAITEADRAKVLVRAWQMIHEYELATPKGRTKFRNTNDSDV